MIIQATLVGGGAYERGHAHGSALRSKVQGHVAAWLAALERGGVGEPRAYVDRMLAETDFTSAINAHTPGLLEEVNGIADGAEAPRPLIFAVQLLDEEWAYRVRRRDDDAKLEKCSSFAIAQSDGPTWIGQNMDLGAYTDGAQALLRIADDGEAPEALVFTVAGMIGLMGVNAAGVGVCVNSLPQLPSSGEGVPVAFVLRRLLQAHSLAEAVEIVLSIPHATNQHYVIAEPGGARSFEASAAGVTEYHPPDPTRVLHTNHPLAAEGAPETEAAHANSAARLASLTARLGAGDRPDLALVQAALSAFDDPVHPVCRLKRDDNHLIGFTTGSMISALSPAPADVEAWVSAGPPSIGGYASFRLAGRHQPNLQFSRVERGADELA
jgi:isopenicillin-N N-acyltransferase-like protein